jgi:hypothetical protein
LQVGASDVGLFVTDGGLLVMDGGIFMTDGGLFVTDRGLFVKDVGILVTSSGRGFCVLPPSPEASHPISQPEPRERVLH